MAPNFKSQKERREVYKGAMEADKLNELEWSGDSYLVRTLDGDYHPFIYHCFRPTATIADWMKKRLQKLL